MCSSATNSTLPIKLAHNVHAIIYIIYTEIGSINKNDFGSRAKLCVWSYIFHSFLSSSITDIGHHQETQEYLFVIREVGQVSLVGWGPSPGVFFNILIIMVLRFSSGLGP